MRIRITTTVLIVVVCGLLLQLHCHFSTTAAVAAVQPVGNAKANTDNAGGSKDAIGARRAKAAEGSTVKQRDDPVVEIIDVGDRTTSTPSPTRPPLLNKPDPEREGQVARNGSTKGSDKPLYRVAIHVFTYNRVQGLDRLLVSLTRADYLGHRVALKVFVDFPKGTGASSNSGHDETLKLLERWQWSHGDFYVHRRELNVGLKKSIMEAWYPTNFEEAAAFFEDDIEVSPLWYVWATRALSQYADRTNYPAEVGVEEKLLGISLFRPIHDELSGKGCKVVNDHNPFALQQPCSWGAVYLPRLWRHFRNWYDLHSSEDPQLSDPADPGVNPSSNTWDSKSSWKKYLIKLMYEKGLYMIYPNLPDKKVLSTNHLMKGEHPLPPRKLFELPLLAEKAVDDILDESTKASFEKFPPLDTIKAFDVMFRPVESLSRLPNVGAPL